ncbi:GNAT family N-acetyltransferase [Nocardioides sp. SYSU DS0651]|uniref:GNAT family N-acetyltransferase n=1 Tax=Nocardioides sp. SYSU DS0651 TaxID=3415955 RepID=UPI003F4C9BA1
MTPLLASDVALGDRAVARLAELSEFVDRHSEAFCTSAAWLDAAARHLPAEPVVVTVSAGDEPVAVAALAVAGRRGVRRVELLGGDLNDYGQLFHADLRAAEALADAIATWLAGQRRWSLSLGQLAEDAPVLAALLGRLPHASVHAGPPMPRISGVGTDYVLSRNRRKKLNNAINRIEADGRGWETVVVEDLPALERWLPAVVELRRRRDHASGRRSHLDDPQVLAFYEAVVRRLVGEGRARIHLLAVDGRAAGYGLAVLDGDTHRLYDGRVAEDLQAYRGGVVCDLLAVAAAAEDPSVTTFDWLRGRTDSKFGNAELRRVELRAVSHAVVTTVDAWESAARRRVKAALPEAAVRRLVAR